MTVNDLLNLSEVKILVAPAEADTVVTGVYTSDLLSDVMTNAEEGQALVTIQAHQNTVAVARLVGIPLVVLCNNRVPDEGMMTAAVRERVAVMSSALNQYRMSLRLGQALGEFPAP